MLGREDGEKANNRDVSVMVMHVFKANKKKTFLLCLLISWANQLKKES